METEQQERRLETREETRKRLASLRMQLAEVQLELARVRSIAGESGVYEKPSRYRALMEREAMLRKLIFGAESRLSAVKRKKQLHIEEAFIQIARTRLEDDLFREIMLEAQEMGSREEA